MDAVGDGLDRVPGNLLPGLGGGTAVELADRVRVRSLAQDEGGHVEWSVGIIRTAATELEELAGVTRRCARTTAPDSW